MPHQNAAPRHLRGFTLIELMVVVAIVGILAAIALPAYNDYVRRARITEAITAIADMRTKMERFFLDNRSYLKGAACGAALPADGSFTFACVATATTFTITATGASNSMSGFEYTVNEAGAKTSGGPAGWGTSNSCWITRKGGQCG